MLCQQWVFTERMAIMLARPFNHIGAGQSPRFVVSDFARQITEIKLGRREPVVDVGDIDVTRDFTDVDDILRGYVALLDAGEPGERYNLCSGREVSIRHPHRLAEFAGVKVTPRQDGARARRSEQRRMAGDPAKMHRTTGWAATTPLDASLTALLEIGKRNSIMADSALITGITGQDGAYLANGCSARDTGCSACSPAAAPTRCGAWASWASSTG